MIYICSEKGFLQEFQGGFNPETQQYQWEAQWVGTLTRAHPFSSQKEAKRIHSKVGGFIWSLKKHQEKNKKKWRISFSAENEISLWRVSKWAHPVNSDLDYLTIKVDNQNYFYTEKEALEEATRRNTEILNKIRAELEVIASNFNFKYAKNLGII